MNTKQRIPPAAQIAIVVVAVLLVAMIGWFMVVNPKSSKASDLSKQIVVQQAALDQARVAAAAAKRQVPIRVANLFRLVKAMPDTQDMSGILLQLNQIAQDSGITFESIKPGTATALSGYAAVPITVNFSGTFYNLSDFLLRLRNLVAVRHGELDATGRLFAVDTLSFGQGHNGFPQIEATLTVDAFIYGGTAPAAPAPPAAPTTTSTTATDTTAASSSATAAGANP